MHVGHSQKEQRLALQDHVVGCNVTNSLITRPIMFMEQQKRQVETGSQGKVNF